MKNLIKKIKNEKGFTLIEMSIVILIVAMLLLIIIPNIGRVEETVNDTTSEAIEQTIETQKVIYRIDKKLSPNAKVSVDTLYSADYITVEQKDHYKATIKKDK